MNATSQFNPAGLLKSAIWLALACLGLSSSMALAEDTDPADRVARVSYLKGEVYTQTNDDDDWADAVINQPLTSGDQLWTDRQGRAELQMGNTTLQIDANTQVKLLELSDDVAQIQVTQGVVNVRVRNLGKSDTVELDTPNAAVSAMESGTYRIEVADQDELTVIQVRAGSVDVAGEQQNYTVREDEQLVLRGRRGSAEFGDVGRLDEFDRWAAQRNQRAERVVSSRYVGDGVIGYEDLDDYGYWRWYGDYGYVWTPTGIVSGWAPYRYGHWGWVSPWGWTWIDDAPWGFAPFHYGRWTTIGSRWCWVPGPRTVRAVYAPALVAWIGTPGLSISVNIGTQPVGWIPLGPREVYRPYYRASHNYVMNVNVSNSRLDNNEFERGYRRQPHEISYANRSAASVVRADTLRNARPVKDQQIRSGGRDLRPLDNTPWTRPEHREQTGNQRTTPPLAPNTREVLARRSPGGQAGLTNGSEGRPSGLRIVEPVLRRRAGAAGAGPEIPGNARQPQDRQNERSLRNWNRSPESPTRAKPGGNSPSVAASPSIRTDSNPDQRDEWRQNRSAVPAAPPDASSRSVAPGRNTQPRLPVVGEPRVRSYSFSEETRSSNRRDNRNADYEAGPTPQPGRSVVPPSTPVQRSRQVAPAPPSTPPANNSSTDRRQDDRSDRGNGRQRGFRGEDR